MQNIIRSLTQNLLKRVPSRQNHYTPAELEAFGYPGYLIKRIRLELERNLADSVSLPDSDWADMQTEPVQDAWDRFLTAIRAETRIPESFIQSVTENAVEDILDLMAEPQRVTLDTLFRSEQATGLVELQTRRPWIVINGHMADALLRYMQRRQLNQISREKAAGVIRQIDAHLNNGFTPLKWAQSLDFWFRLFDEAVPAGMVARFFADKGLDKPSQIFAQTDEYLSRSRLIEFLTTAETAAYESRQAETDPLQSYAQTLQTPDEPDEEPETDPLQSYAQTLQAPDEPDEEPETDPLQSYAQTLQTPDEPDEEPETDPLQIYAQTLQAPDEPDEEPETDPLQIYAQTLQAPDEPDEEPETDPLQSYAQTLQAPDEPDEEPETDPLELYTPVAQVRAQDQTDIFSAYNDDIQDDEIFTEDTSNSDQPPYETIHPTDPNTTELPIWQRFLGDDHDETEHDNDSDETADESDNEDLPFYASIIQNETDEDDQPLGDGFTSSDEIDYPDDETHGMDEVIYLTDDAKTLLSYLIQSREIFVQLLFNEDDASFYTELNTIAAFKDWPSAGKYITREIFLKNDVDLYASEAVMFIDLVQQFFEEYR
jgi:hypothetical protein